MALHDALCGKHRVNRQPVAGFLFAGRDALPETQREAVAGSAMKVTPMAPKLRKVPCQRRARPCDPEFQAFGFPVASMPGLAAPAATTQARTLALMAISV